MISPLAPKQKQSKTFSTIENLTGWVGSVPSLVLHTLLFAGAFVVGLFGLIEWAMILLILTTAVSLEAIYLAIFIQMTVNEHTRSLREVQEDIDEIEDDIDEIQEDVEEMLEEVEEIQEGDEQDIPRKDSQAIALQKLLQDMESIKKSIEKIGM